MAITERKRLAELSFRYNSDNTVSATQRFVTEIVKDGSVIASTDGAATTVNVADVGASVQGISASLIAERDALLTQVADLTTQLASLTPPEE